ncbi:hypothetical protein QJS10_CPB15g02193 [Acorus calamus]|uniref:C2 NT-type domain-containing protein n=1 Tax=Acorus calamus TaxID=4465 RepID=A0AAV9D9Z3_ACOCL|nr:hypothetical protein QJS10_CPB15g02193 [Acorus calamus]
MVVKMMRWRPWPPLPVRKYEVRLVLVRLEGVPAAEEGAAATAGVEKVSAEVRWKGGKAAGLGSLRRSVMRNFTREGDLRAEEGVVEWGEEFRSVCSLISSASSASNKEGKEGGFLPWEIGFTVFNGSKQGSKNKVSVVGTTSLNLAEYASAAEESEIEINIPLSGPGIAAEPHPSLYLSLSMLELRTVQGSPETVPRSIAPAPLSPGSGEPFGEKDEVSALKAGLRKVKIFTDYVSARKAKKPCREDEGSEGICSAKSDEADYNYPFDTDSLDEVDEGDLEDEKNDTRSIRKSFNYGTLASANFIGRNFYSSTRINGEFEDWVYYSNRKSDMGSSHAEELVSSASEQSLTQVSKRSILPWRKRKLSFRSPKAKGEPLLKKAYGEEGGDDIDYDRRQLSSSDESLSLGWHKVDDDVIANRSSVSEFGDDNFAVGSWENKEVVSRDGHMKLQTQVFFASIDQRSERAAGESACTALVAVISDWFQTNGHTMPIKSQFDSLIREGSLEWRNLCENETYRERFPDKHFDLETVLQAKIRPLSVVPEKSFIGFFHPEEMDNCGGGLEFLHGAMSFDGIWDEICQASASCPNDGSPQIYIVSWNDHFFVLKIEPDAYYIIDTLGERLFEGCSQAFILKFDEKTMIHRVSQEEKPAAAGDSQPSSAETGSDDDEKEEEVLCRGKESCKEYIKSFLAAIPIRELQADINKGRIGSTPLHHRLQIEFHYTKSVAPSSPLPVLPAVDTTMARDTSQLVMVETDTAEVAEVPQC